MFDPLKILAHACRGLLSQPCQLCWHVMALACILVVALPAVAQTDAQYSQYYEVPSIYNPAAIGNTDNLKMRIGGRLQWLGIDNAPQSFLATGDMPFKFGKQRFGVGAYVEGETMGLFSSLNVGAQLAFKYKKFGGELAGGITIGMYDQRFEGSDVFIPDDNDYHQSSDDAIPTRDIHGTALDIALGLWYHNPRFWAGLSCTHLTAPTITMKSEGTASNAEAYNYEFKAERTLYLMAGGNIPLKNTLFELMPTLLAKTDIVFTTGEAHLRARYNKFMIFGIGYRWQDAVIASFALELKDFFVGYSYEYSATAISKASFGSHEVFLGYSMKLDLSEKNKNKHKSIRIM